MQRRQYSVLYLLLGGILLLGCGSAGGPDEASSGGDVQPQSIASQEPPTDIDPESRSRLPIRKREEMKPEDQEIYDRFVGDDSRSLAGLSGPKGVRLYSPQAGWHLSRANRILRFESGVDPAVRELVIMVAARHMDSQFEWTMHENVGLEAGLDPAAVEAVKYNKSTEGLQERDALLIRFGRELMRETKLSSQTFQEMLQAFGPEDLITLTQIMGGVYLHGPSAAGCRSAAVLRPRAAFAYRSVRKKRGDSLLCPIFVPSLALAKPARIMHKFSTASQKSLVLTVLRSVGLLSVPYSTLAVASVARFVRPALSALRDENLCIIWARNL